jgi:alanyl-tRNA synthetase
MIERFEGSEILENIKDLKKNAKSLREMAEGFTSEEDKQTEEYKALVDETKDIEESLETLVSEEEKVEIQKLGEIETYIQHLQAMIDAEDTTPELKQKAERQIFLIKSSYTFEVLSEPKVRPNMKTKNLRENFVNLRKNAERKLERNQSFRFHSVFKIESKIKSVLPEELKGQARVVTSFIYALINTVSLQPDGYAMFIFFLIKNINGIDKPFAERQELIDNLIELAKTL